MSVLEDICKTKEGHIAKRQENIPLSVLREKAENMPIPKGFIASIKKYNAASHTALITEVKRASPSQGLIREDFDALRIAEDYQAAGACCLSVLTDEPYFQGSDEYLVTISTQVQLPVLRKDFIIDPYQVYETRALGADCLLLIVAALEDGLMQELYDCSKNLSLDVLVEVHNQEELERALALSCEMIGVNNRNLKTLEVNTQTSFDLVEQIPESCVRIAESGITNRQTVSRLEASGYDGFLVGEHLMRQDNLLDAVQLLLEK